MSAKQYSRIFEKIDKNPAQYKKYYASIAEQVSAQNFDVIENIVVQMHDVLAASNSRPDSKMLAVRLFKDLLPTASYGFMLYSQSYLLNEIIKIIEFKIKGGTEDWQKYLFSSQPDTNLAQIGRSTYAMALEALKFAAETMTLHPYQRLSFPSIFRIEYNRLSPLVRFPETYKFIPETEKAKFSSNYNGRIKDIKNIIKAFENRLHSRMSFCLSQGNFEVKSWLVKFMYTGESNIIPYVLSWVTKQVQNPQINTSTKVEMMDFLNEVFVIGDIQIMNEFNNYIIPAMIEIVYPVDFREFKIVNNNHGVGESLRQRAKECLSFWGQISPETSELLQCFSEKSPLLQGSRLYQSYAAFSQALELNILYRNEINVGKQKFLTSKDLTNHLKLLNQFYAKYPVGNELVFVEEKIVVTDNFVRDVPFTRSEEFGYNIRTSEVNLVELQEPSQSAINQLSMPGNSSFSKPLSAGYGNNLNQQENYHRQPVSPFFESPIAPTGTQVNLDRSRISFTESNISNRIQELEQMQRMTQLQGYSENVGVKFMDKVEVMNYEVHNQDNPKIFLEKRNLSSHISSRVPAGEGMQGQKQMVAGQVQEPIEFHDSYANQQQQYQGIIRDVYPRTPASQYYEGEEKQYLPSETIIRTVTKPQFKFPVVSQQKKVEQQAAMIRRVKSTHMMQPFQSTPHVQVLQQQQQPFQQHTYQPLYQQQTQIVQQQYYYPTKIQPILFSPTSSYHKPNTGSLLKKSKSSSNFNGALYNLNESMRILEQKPYNPSNHFNQFASSPNNNYQYEQRIKVLETEVQTCLAVDEIHREEMRQLKQQLYDVNNKVQHMASLQTFQPVVESVVVKNVDPPVMRQITTEHIEIVQSPPTLTHSQHPVIRLPKEIQQWTLHHPNCKLLDIPPIRTTSKRKRQLMRNKEVLHKTKHCQIGFILILKDYLEITVYYYFTSPATEFKTQLHSPDLRCIQNTSFSYIPYVDAGTQKKQSYRFSYPALSSLPFATPEILVSYLSANVKQEFSVLLPCIFLKFLTTIEKQPPQYHFSSFRSSPFVLSPVFERYENLGELLPGLIPLPGGGGGVGGVKEYGVECCYLESTVYVRLVMFRDGFCVIRVEELRAGGDNRKLVRTVVEDLISILSTDV